MVFPQTVLPLIVELYLGGSWVDVTPHVYRRDMVDITRGRSAEASQADRSTAALTLNNRDGRYSPRNPTSPYYGQLGRNTPIRVAVERGPAYLLAPGGSGDYASTPDSAALSVTGDIDVRIDVRLDVWRGTSQDLIGKWTSGGQGSWALYLISGGTLRLYWTTDGSTLSSAESTAEVPVPATGGLAVRVTLDVNNGSGGKTVTFYTAASLSGSWTQLGDPVTTAGTTSVFDSTSPLFIGKIPSFSFAGLAGRVLAAEYRNGIGGTGVATPDFTTQTPSATSFADTASPANTWTLAGATEISNRQYRFCGEVSGWPPRWDTTGGDVYVPVEASGVLRRLSQGGQALGSALYRGRLLDTAGLVGYWPMEDAEGSTSLAPALAHGPLSITAGSPNLASVDGFVASNPILALNGAELRGSAPAYTDTGETQIRFLLAVPSGGATDGQTLIAFYTTGSVRRWECHYGTGGTLGLRAYDPDGTQLFDTGDVAFAVNGQLLMVSVELTQSGANISYAMSTLEPGASSGLTTAGTLNSHTVGRVGTLVISPAGGLTETAVGHLSVQNAVTNLFDLGAQLAAWAGETAGNRIKRLCGEEGVTFRPVGDLDESARMGIQRPDTLIALIREAADTDAGMLYEPREVLGLGYRTRTSLYNQPPRVALTYAAHELADGLEPVDDDQAIRNDFAVTREGGSSARAVLENGPLSVLAPPDGVGRYEEAVTVNVQHDLDLFDQAAWRLHLGTVDEARYPQIAVNLAHPALTGDPALTADIVAAEVGDRLTIASPPAWLPPETISQLIQGSTERLGNYEWDLGWNCSPESPYQVAVYGASRYGPHSTVTTEPLDTTETGVDITTPTGPLWSTAPGGTFDILIGGERMTVTAVGVAAGTVQTLTVTRSVSGVVKSHAVGAQVQLFTPSIYAL